MKPGPNISDQGREVVNPLLFSPPGSYLPLAIAFKILFQEKKPSLKALEKSENKLQCSNK